MPRALLPWTQTAPHQPQLRLLDPLAGSYLTCHVFTSMGLPASARHREGRKDRILILFILTQKINAEHIMCVCGVIFLCPIWSGIVVL